GYISATLARLRRGLLIAAAVVAAAVAAAAASARLAVEPLQAQEWWLTHIGADQVAPPGQGIPLIVVDSGVDPSHPEFVARPNTTMLNEQTVQGGTEFHGTAVASIAAAPADGSGLLGVYPQANLFSWDASATGSIFDQLAAEGITAAAQHCPGVINLSFGGSQNDTAIAAAVLT